MDSFIDGLLLYDFTDNQDRGFTSWYIYLPQGSRQFFMGPVWDFDQSMDNASLTPESINCAAKQQYRQQHNQRNDTLISFIEMLLSHREFTDRMAERFSALQKAFTEQLDGKVADLFARIHSSAAMDSVRWGYSVDQKKDIELPDFVRDRTEVLSFVYAHSEEQIEDAYKRIEQNGGLPQEDQQTYHNSTGLVVMLTITTAAAAFIVIMVLRRRRG